MQASEPNRDYAVGYGRTPVHTRWKKGQSGNPRGRPPGRSSKPRGLTRLVEKALKRRVDAPAPDGGGKPMRLAAFVVERLTEAALQGDVRALCELMRSMRVMARAESRRIEAEDRAQLAAQADDPWRILGLDETDHLLARLGLLAAREGKPRVPRWAVDACLERDPALGDGLDDAAVARIESVTVPDRPGPKSVFNPEHLPAVYRAYLDLGGLVVRDGRLCLSRWLAEAARARRPWVEPVGWEEDLIVEEPGRALPPDLPRGRRPGPRAEWMASAAFAAPWATAPG